MSVAQDKRIISLPFGVTYGTLADPKTYYGAMNARVGLFKALFKEGDDLASGCNKGDKVVSVKTHTRRRKISDEPKTIQGHQYAVEIFPRKNVSFAKGGEEYKVLLDGSWWSFRISGKQSVFHAFLCSNRASLKEDMYYKTQHGASYYVNKTGPA